MDFEALMSRWTDMSFPDFAASAQRLGGISSDKVNSMICGVAGDKRAEASLRFIAALHFQLGRRAEFQLNDRSIAVLCKLIHSATEGGGALAATAELSVMLLALNSSESTKGVEQQLCAEFLCAAAFPSRQLVFVPLVRRAFYQTLRVSSLSRGAFDSLIKTHATDTKIHHRLRLAALIASTPEDMSEYVVTQLLCADTHGNRALFGGAPQAIGLDGRAARIFTLLHRNENSTPSQVHHCYLMAALRQHIRCAEGELALTPDAYAVIVDYLREVFAQVTAACSHARCVVFSTNKVAGLQFIEAVTCEAVMLAQEVHQHHLARGGADESIAGDVTGLLYLVLQVSRRGSSKLPADEAPELHSSELVVHTSASPNAQHSPHDFPHFSAELVLTCLEFLVRTATTDDEVLAVFDDIFGPRLWQHYLTHSPMFPTQLCLLLLRNATKLSALLPRIAPRVMWLLSQYPHTLFPLVKRLIPHMMGPGTAVDLFCRITLLPLLCFVNDHRPVFDPGTEVEEEVFVLDLWCALEDWEVPLLGGPTTEGNDGEESRNPATTAFADLCLSTQRAFSFWDALHAHVDFMGPKMMAAFRIVKPLLAAYFNCAELPSQIFDLITFGYFSMLAPLERRGVVADFLLEMARWLVETRPELAAAPCAIDAFSDMILQPHVPPSHRSHELQRFGSIAAAVTLSGAEGEAAAKQAAYFFDLTHESIWELLAVASTAVTEMDRDSGRPSTLSQRAAANLRNASTAFSVSSMLEQQAQAQSSSALAADFVADSAVRFPAPAPTWNLHSSVWRCGPQPTVVHGVAFTQHMHSLVIALTLLTKRAPNLQERGVVCLANVVRTLQRASNAGVTLAATATLCMKYLRHPAMDGVETMPLRALLGVNGL